MRFVSLNAWGGACWPALSEWLPSVGADILCLQEMIRAAEPSPEWLVYRDPYRVLDQRADLFGDVSNLLPTHAGHFAAAVQGPLEDGAGRVYRSDHGVGLWLREDLTLDTLEARFIHGAHRPDGWGAEPVPRVMQVARVIVDGRPLIFGHLHGLRDPDGKQDTPARAAQAEAIAAAIKQLQNPGDPVILAGDFNLLPESRTFARLAALGLTELVTARGHTDTRTSLYKKPQRFADYLLVSPDVQVRAFDLPATPEVSDHRALVLDFEI